MIIDRRTQGLDISVTNNGRKGNRLDSPLAFVDDRTTVRIDKRYCTVATFPHFDR
jgi:hypothetical protein